MSEEIKEPRLYCTPEQWKEVQAFEERKIKMQEEYNAVVKDCLEKAIKEMVPRTTLNDRDVIAIAAMQGLLSGNAVYGGRSDDRAALAADAYGHADAMMKRKEA